MYRDLITKINKPSLYTFMSGKSEQHYDYVLESRINIITQERAFEIEIDTIIIDSEQALINVVKKYFPNSRKIACFFHYKQDLVRNIRQYGLSGLYKRDAKI